MADPSDRLDSWKEIAAYLRRSVRTVTRWEQEEGLPVHRLQHSKSGTVYAFKPELDSWWASRGRKLERPSDQSTEKPPRHHPLSIALAILATALAAAGAAWFLAGGHAPVSTAQLLPLTTYPGIEGPPSLSPDGNQVAFERAGDIFVKQVDSEALVQVTRTSTPEQSPAWSPDGRRIAFLRADGIFLTSPLGGGEQKVADLRLPLLLRTMAWTPDGRSLVVSEMTSSIGASLFVVSVATGQKTRLTTPSEPSIGDGWPAVSADGGSVAFARYSQDTSANVFVVPLSGGVARQLTEDGSSLFGLTWLTGADIVFSSDRGGTSRLWRLNAARLSAPTVVDAAGEGARFPSFAPRRAPADARLAYQRFSANVDIRRAEIVGEGTPDHALGPSSEFIASTAADDHPRYSPDGSKIAFVSHRSGAPEIWTCADDASNPVRATALAGPIVVGPQWSADGHRLAFFATTGVAGKYAMYVVGADGGAASRLTAGADGALEALPSWSHDGRWIYFTSSRGGSLQIWKMPTGRGPAVQLTQGGGAEALESPDGRIVYYAKVPEIGRGLWRVPSTGGDEVKVLDSVRFGYWTVTGKGIYFVDFDVPDGTARPVMFYSFETRRTARIGTVESTVAWRNTPGFAVSPDGRWLLYSILESSDADLMLIDGLR